MGNRAVSAAVTVSVQPYICESVQYTCVTILNTTRDSATELSDKFRDRVSSTTSPNNSVETKKILHCFIEKHELRGGL